MNGERLSIVVPLYNEERRIARLVEDLAAHAREDVAAAGLELLEVIAVDDGSTDATAARLRAAAETFGLLRTIADATPNAGKGAAVARGVAAARGEWVLVIDADLATPLDQLAALTALVDSGTDVAIASRDQPGSIVVGAPRHRFVLGRAFNRIVRSLTGLRLRDTQCGFKLLRTADARRLTRKQVVHRWAFDVELLLRARQAGLEVAEAPVYYVHGEDSTVDAWSAGPRMLLDVLLVIRAIGRSSDRAREHGR
jgi:dolichyl-phosphate beta-glucosyltransferase